MSEHLVQWWQALAAVAAGLLLGAAALWRIKRLGLRPTLASEYLQDLEERFTACVTQLRDLDEQRPRLTDEDYATQRREFEHKAAAILREQQSHQERAAEQPQSDAQRAQENISELSPFMRFWAKRPQLSGALWGGGTVAVIAALYIWVAQDGKVQPAMQQAPQPSNSKAAATLSDPEMQSLYETLQRNPKDQDALVRMAHRLLAGMMIEEAKIVNDRALQLAPNLTEALVHAAVIRVSAGESAAGITDLENILKQHPDFVEAWFFRGMLAMQAGDTPNMKRSFEQYLKHAPEGAQKERIRMMLQNAAPQ